MRTWLRPPDRETPGIRARLWANPIRTPSRKESAPTSRDRLPNRSASPSRMPNTISIEATSQRFRAAFSIWFSKARPKIAIGIVAATRYQPIRAFRPLLSSGRKSEPVQSRPIPQRSFRK
jgi:hypothetical protein